MEGEQILLDKLEEEIRQARHPNTEPEQEEVKQITSKVNAMLDLQTRTWRHFNDRNQIDYCSDNEKRINNYVLPRGADLDDWQTIGFEGITREKMFAFVSKVAMRRPEYVFKATKKDGFIDRSVAEVVGSFYEHSWNVEDPSSVEFFFDAWATAGNGTGIRYEGVEQEETVHEDFDSYDFKTGTVHGLREETVEGLLQCKSRRVRPLDFLVPDWSEPNLQRQPYIAEVTVMNRSRFDDIFGGYYNADKVPHLKEVRELYGESFYMSQFDGLQDEFSDKVHITFFYSKEKRRRRFRIIANGVLILATPFPRKDGKYPYAKGIFKPFADTNFFWGKALPDEIAWDQDIYNAFKNMVVDRSILHVNRPLVTDAATEVDDVFMSPSKILSLKGNITQLDIQPPGPADMAMLEYLKSSINNQTTSIQQSGQTGKGVTAREIVIADENARKLAGVFRIFLEAFDMEAAKLRVGTIMQLYFEPTMLREVLSDEDLEDFKMAYRSISLPGKKLSDGMLGTKTIQLVGKSSDVPDPTEIMADEVAARNQGMELEKLVVSSEYIKNFTVDLTILTESSFEQSRSLQLALENEYQQLVSRLYPEYFQQFKSVFFRQLNELYGKDMSEFDVVEGPPAPQPIGEEAPGSNPQRLAKMPMTEQMSPQGLNLGRLVGSQA